MKRHQVKEIREKTIQAISSGNVRDIRARAKKLVKHINRNDLWELVHIFKDEDNWKLRSLVAEIFKAMGGKDILVKLEEFVSQEKDWRVNESYQVREPK